MKHTLSVAVLVLCVGALFPLVQAQADRSLRAPKKEIVYDGQWWSAAEPEERSGFLNGAADCLAEVAHEKWVSRSVEWAVPRITGYYAANSASRAVPVVEVWHKLISEAPGEPPLKGGEVYTNPHGYYDGLYWRQGSDAEHVGFLRGYLWCLPTKVASPSETYSRPVSYYAEKLDAYFRDFKAHPKGDHEAIAVVLARFRDKPDGQAKTPAGKL
jgi:hypothetical protein